MTRAISEPIAALHSLFMRVRSTKVFNEHPTDDGNAPIDLDAELRRYGSVGERVVSHAFAGLVLYGMLVAAIAALDNVLNGTPGQLAIDRSSVSMSMVDGATALAVLVTVAIALQLVLATGGGSRPSDGPDPHGRLVAMADVARVTGFLSFVIAASVTLHGWPARIDVLGAVITFSLAAVVASIAADAELAWGDLERVERALHSHHKQNAIDRLRRAVAYWEATGSTGQEDDRTAPYADDERTTSTAYASDGGGGCRESTDEIARSADRCRDSRSRLIRSGLGLLATCSVVPCCAWVLLNLHDQPSPALAYVVASSIAISAYLLVLMFAAAGYVALRQPSRALVSCTALALLCIGMATRAATLWDGSRIDAIVLQVVWLSPMIVGAASLAGWRRGFLRARVASTVRAEIRRLQANEPGVSKRVTRSLRSRVRLWYAKASGVVLDDESNQRAPIPLEGSSR